MRNCTILGNICIAAWELSPLGICDLLNQGGFGTSSMWG